ncbi:MAG TPA: Clp protease N-terminal domain-containing protein [Candidatus Acidoferrum sp.]|nr:Clp protease N-terminal domain-containing protein [Candidatus Acidoferrum sp.]
MFLTAAERTLSGSELYPFERFTEGAKGVLSLAQEEAERSHHSYIGTEHLLLGLLRQRDTTAADVLRELGIDIDAVRATIASVLGRDERIIIQQTIPTSRVKKVIEIAFDEAGRRAQQFVEPGHILAALVIEGEGIAAHVLADMGATQDRVLEALDRKWGVEAGPPRKRPMVTFPRQMRMRQAEMRTLAGHRQPQPPASDTEALARLLGSPEIAKLLHARGVDVQALLDQLRHPPEEVVKVRGELTAARAEVLDAAGEQNYERAARAQKRVDSLVARLKRAEAAWLNQLGS